MEGRLLRFVAPRRVELTDVVVGPLGEGELLVRTQWSGISGGTELLAKIMPELQLLDVQTFLVNHTADSLQPETCGK